MVSARQLPPEERGQRDKLERADEVQFGRERLLACLVPKQSASGIGAGCATEERQPEQVGFGYPPRLCLGQHLVDPEGGERHEIDRDYVERELERGDQIEQFHGRDLGGHWLPNG